MTEQHDIPLSDEEAIDAALVNLRQDISSLLPDAEGSDMLSDKGFTDESEAARNRPIPGIFGTGPDFSNDPEPDRRKLYIGLVIGGILILLIAGGVLWSQVFKSVATPDLVGISSAEAVKRLNGVELRLGSITEKEVAGVEPGIVVDQKPRVDTSLERGDSVSITIAKESNTSNVPSVTGKTVAQATALLTEQRLVLKRVATYSNQMASGNIVGQLPVGDTIVASGSTVTVLVSAGPYTTPISVPRVLGLSEDEARKVLKSAGLNPVFYVASTGFGNLGEVAAQTPSSKSAALPGSTVQVLVSRGNSTAENNVPEVVGMTNDNAVKTLEDAGFVCDLYQTVDAEVPIGTIIAQMPVSKDTMLKTGEAVGLLVSRGPSSDSAVPDVLGLDIDQATTELSTSGFVPVVVPLPKGAPLGKITQQLPAGGSTYKLGLTVLLYAP